MSSTPVLKLTSTVQGQSEIVFDQGDLDKLAAVLAPLVAAEIGGGDALAPLEDRMFAAERRISSMLSKGEINDLVQSRINRALQSIGEEPVPDPTPKPRR